MQIVRVGLIEFAFAIVVSVVLANLFIRALNDAGVRGRFLPCSLAMVAINTAWLMFSASMLEGPLRGMDDLRGIVIMWLAAFALSVVVIGVLAILNLLLVLLGKKAKKMMT